MSEGYQVIARRWRPKQFDELVGQEHIVRTLKNAIEQNRIAHAYLFVGPRGTGKTTTARIFAKALNAEGGPNVAPDDSSAISQSIMNGSCMDVIEIDGASNNGVDDIRDIRDECQYAPTEGQFKIYIIDEVHMLSNNAWNALLKTLEEPPPHVKFIFATTEAHKVLATVVSRCQRFEFRPIPDEKIVGKLQQIAEAEGITVEAAALESIARMADGGMRDAQSILDQLISFCGTNISETNVLDVYGLASKESIQNMAKSMAAADHTALMPLVDTLVEEGRDLYRVLIDLQAYVRQVLLEAIRQKGQTDALGVTMSSEALMRMVEALHEGEGAIRMGLSQRVNFEVTLLKAIEQSRTRAIDSVIKELSQIAAGLPQEAGQKKIEVSLPEKDSGQVSDSNLETKSAITATTSSNRDVGGLQNRTAQSGTTSLEVNGGEDVANGPTDAEWKSALEAASTEEVDSPQIPTPTQPLEKGLQVFGLGTAEFEAAKKSIPEETLDLLDDLLRADFKYVRTFESDEVDFKSM